VREFVGFEGDVLALGILVAFDDLGFLDDFGLIGSIVWRTVDGGGKDLLVLYALAGLAVDLVEVDVGPGFGCDEELDAEADEGDLDLSGPVGACHGVTSKIAMRLEAGKELWVG
jgi:hypothetical protein